MTITYPIIETQLRLIRALQKGYVEALEAGDWQAANYRCLHLHKLCEGLHHLSQLLDRESSIPDAVPQKSVNSWVSSIRSTAPINSLTQSPDSAEKPVVSPSSPEGTRYEWGIGFQGINPPPIDEVWE
ncbi:MAG TPA: hypothetical protein V6D43_01560 [Candidatus Sericytochromatia bacterium]|jgi:arginine/lysine/ornithine decarboxylase